MGAIVVQTEFISLSKATSLEEGKLPIQVHHSSVISPSEFFTYHNKRIIRISSLMVHIFSLISDCSYVVYDERTNILKYSYIEV